MNCLHYVIMRCLFILSYIFYNIDKTRRSDFMLSENIKNLRRSKGLSQQELADQLHVVRQTVSKWENGLSVPDADMLICLSKCLDTSVSFLLAETNSKIQDQTIQSLANKLEIINLQLAKRKENRQKMLHFIFIFCSVFILLGFLILYTSNSFYTAWSLDNIETAILIFFLHSFEWLFIRLAPILLIGSVVGIFLTRKKDSQNKKIGE